MLSMVGTLYPLQPQGVFNFLGILPFYHIYGMHPKTVFHEFSYSPLHFAGVLNLLNFTFACGLPTIIQAQFDPVQFCANIERYKITCVGIVPPVLVALARHPGTLSSDHSRFIPFDRIQ
jgi:4-coumarate--CoA ligase